MPNVTTIGEQAFFNNTILTTVTMPSSFNNQTTLNDIFNKENIQFNFTNPQSIRKLKNKGR